MDSETTDKMILYVVGALLLTSGAVVGFGQKLLHTAQEALTNLGILQPAQDSPVLALPGGTGLSGAGLLIVIATITIIGVIAVRTHSARTQRNKEKA